MSVGATVKPAIDMVSRWAAGAAAADEEKRTYQDKLERASADEVFKYVFLINNASVEKYVQQSREQAQSAFFLSRRVAVAGFGLVSVGIVIGLVSQFTDNALTTAYLAGIGGVLTEFIAGVFFWMYNRTLQQINVFYEGMMTQQKDALAAIGRASESAAEAQRYAAEARRFAGEALKSAADADAGRALAAAIKAEAGSPAEEPP